MDTNLLRLTFAVKQLKESNIKTERIKLFAKIVEIVEAMKWDTAYNVISEDTIEDNKIFNSEYNEK